MNDAADAQKDLERFVNDVLTQKNLPGLTDDVRPDVVEHMVGALRELIDRAILEALPEDRLDQLNGMLDDASTTKEQVAQFVQDSGVDTEYIATQTMIHFRELYLEGPKGAQA